MERLNPFLSALVVPYIRIIKKEVSDYQLAGDGLEPGDSFHVEAEKYSRLYRNVHTKSMIAALNAPALQLFMWIMLHIPDDALSIKLDETSLTAIFDCSDKTISRMKSTLIANAVIAKREDNRYWINPVFFASSDRLKLYPENAVIVHTIKQR